jgi:hypothetical protein
VYNIESRKEAVSCQNQVLPRVVICNNIYKLSRLALPYCTLSSYWLPQRDGPAVVPASWLRSPRLPGLAAYIIRAKPPYRAAPRSIPLPFLSPRRQTPGQYEAKVLFSRCQGNGDTVSPVYYEIVNPRRLSHTSLRMPSSLSEYPTYTTSPVKYS